MARRAVRVAPTALRATLAKEVSALRSRGRVLPSRRHALAEDCSASPPLPSLPALGVQQGLKDLGSGARAGGWPPPLSPGAASPPVRVGSPRNRSAAGRGR